jgi:hypothetical protein
MLAVICFALSALLLAIAWWKRPTRAMATRVRATLLRYLLSLLRRRAWPREQHSSFFQR